LLRFSWRKKELLPKKSLWFCSWGGFMFAMCLIFDTAFSCWWCWYLRFQCLMVTAEANYQSRLNLHPLHSKIFFFRAQTWKIWVFRYRYDGGKQTSMERKIV
jgi:hypothetical protein